MKLKIDNYTFNKTAKTVTFLDYTSIDLSAVLLITNVTDNIIIYNFANPTRGGTVATNVLTLDYDTSSMDDSDELQIFYEDTTVSVSTEQAQEEANTLLALVQTLIETNNRLVQALQPLASAMNAGQPAVRTIPVGTTAVSGSVTVASTVVSSLTNFGTGIPAKEMADDMNNLVAVTANINKVTL